LLSERLPDFIWLPERDELDSRFTRGGVLREILLSFVERLLLFSLSWLSDRLRLILVGRCVFLSGRLLLFSCPRLSERLLLRRDCIVDWRGLLEALSFFLKALFSRTLLLRLLSLRSTRLFLSPDLL
jgi:hypothetical protein